MGYVNKKTQTAIEYSLLFFCVVTALLAMHVYIKRGLQGKYRELADSVGEQYSPTYTKSHFVFSVNSDKTIQIESKEEQGKTQTTATTRINQDKQSTEGWEKVDKLDRETLF